MVVLVVSCALLIDHLVSTGCLYVSKCSQTAHILLSCHAHPRFIPSPQSIQSSTLNFLLGHPRMSLHLERKSLRVEAHVLQRASRPGYVAAGTAVADDVNVNESHASPSAESPVEPSTRVSTKCAPVWRTWSTIKELHSRLRQLGAPIYGTKDVLFRRLCEYEQIAARKKKEEDYLENRGKSWRWRHHQ